MLKVLSAASIGVLVSACASQQEFTGRGYAFQRGEQLARHVGVKPALVHYVIKKESGGNMHAANPASSARGPMQVIDGTAEAIAERPVSRAERMTDVGLKLGVAYLKTCQHALPGESVHSIWVKCYVTGHGNVDGDIALAKQAFKMMYGV
jgi:hypothetical protein